MCVCVCERDEYSSPPRLHNSLITCLEFSLVANVCLPSLAVRTTVGRSKQLIHATVTYHPFRVFFLVLFSWLDDRLCGLVVRVSGYRYRGLGFDSRHYQIFSVVVGLERGPLSLVRSIEELLE